MVKNTAIALDTCVAIELLKGNSRIRSEIKNYHVTYLPVTVCGELIFGAINSGNRKQNYLKVKDFINDCVVLNSNRLVADQYAITRKNLAIKGKPIPENDIWIAAICLIHDLRLITLDKHFKHIDALDLTLTELS